MASINWQVKLNKLPKMSGPDAARHVAMALRAEAEEIITDAKANYVPVVTGVLRASGGVNDPKVTNTSATVEFGFGDHAQTGVGGSRSPAWKYALAVHEAPPGKGQGMNKYLEKPCLKAVAGMDGRIAARVRDQMAKGF